MIHRFIELRGRIVPEPDLMKWAQWYEEIRNRRVSWTRIEKFTVSTIFLGLDHNFGQQEGGPVLWETMVYWKGKPKNQRIWLHQERCQGERDNAKAMHARVCAMVLAGAIWWA